MRYLIFFLLALTLCSCTSIYLPTTTIPTNFEEEQELSVSGSIASTGIFGNIAYSPIKHFYLHAEGAYFPGKDWYSEARNTTNISAGIGSYYSLNDNNNAEIQLSIGGGEFDWVRPPLGFSESFNLANGTYKQVSGFGSITMKNSSNFFVSVILRVSYLDIRYRETSLSYLDNKRFNLYQLGPHIHGKLILAGDLNVFSTFGIEGHSYNVAKHYHNNVVFLRIGFEWRLGQSKNRKPPLYDYYMGE